MIELIKSLTSNKEIKQLTNELDMLYYSNRVQIRIIKDIIFMNQNSKMIIKKKYYEFDNPITDLTDEKQRLQFLFKCFFQQRNCNSLFNIINKYSAVDAILTSGDTNILIEFKNRFDKSIADFESVIIEFDKFIRIKDAAKLFDCSNAFYIMEFNDAIIIYDIDFVNGYKWEDNIMPSSYYNGRPITKLIAYVPYQKASYIIGKRTMQQATVEQLLRYIQLKKSNNLNQNTNDN